MKADHTKEDFKYWSFLLNEARSVNFSDHDKAHIISKCKNYLSEKKYSAVREMAARMLYLLDPNHVFGMDQFTDADMLSGKLHLMRITQSHNDLLYLLSSLLSNVEHIDVTCIHRLCEYMRENVETFTTLHDQATTHKILRSIVFLWHSNMDVVGVANAITKSICNSIIFLFQKTGFPSSEMLRHFIENIPYYVKFKYAFLGRLLNKTPFNEVDVKLLSTCYYHLEHCLEEQCLASITAGPMLLTAEKFTKLKATTALTALLRNTLTSSNRLIQANACRLWLPKLAGELTSATLIFENLLNDLESLLYDLNGVSIDIDSSFADWKTAEIVAFAWVNCLKHAAKTSVPMNAKILNLLRVCLRSRQHAIKVQALAGLNALRLANKLTDVYFWNECSTFVSSNSFEDHVDLRNCVVDTIQSYPIDARISWLCDTFRNWANRLVLQRPKADFRLLFLRVLKSNMSIFNEYCQKLSECLEYDLLKTKLLNCLMDTNEQSIRQAAFDIIAAVVPELNDEKSSYGVYVKDEIITSLSSYLEEHRRELLVIHVAELLIRLGVDVPVVFDYNDADNDQHVIFDNVDELPVKIAIASLKHQHGQLDAASVKEICAKSTQMLLRVGGSPRAGECLNVSQLNSHFAALAANRVSSIKKNNNHSGQMAHEHEDCTYSDDSADEDTAGLVWSFDQKRLLSAYANSLIEICSAVSHLASAPSVSVESIANDLLPLVWNVLLRTHHKGVLQKCANHFDSVMGLLAVKCDAVQGQEIATKLMQRTLDVLLERRCTDGLCKSRDIGFAEIFHSVCRHFYDLTNACVEALLLPFADGDANCSEVDNLAASWSSRSAFYEPQERTGTFHVVEIRKRVLFLLRRFLQSSSLDLRPMYIPICQLLVRHLLIADSDDWKCYTMYCSTFGKSFFVNAKSKTRCLVALTDAIYSGYPTRVPLANFCASHGAIVDIICATFERIIVDLKMRRSHVKCLPVLAAALERLVIVGYPFQGKSSCMKRYESIVHAGIRLLHTQPSLFVQRQIVDMVTSVVHHNNAYEKLEPSIVHQLFSFKDNNTLYSSLMTFMLKSSVNRHFMLAEPSQSYDSVYFLCKKRRLQNNSAAQLNASLSDTLKHAVQLSYSRNVMKRIEAAELFVLFFSENANSKNTELMEEVRSAVCALLHDDVEEIRLITCLCSLCLDIPFSSKVDDEPLNHAVPIPLDNNTCLNVRRIRLI